MRARARKRDIEAVGQLRELSAAHRHQLRDLGERCAAARLDLDLGSDQLAHDVLVELAARCRGLQLLEAVRELERLRVEQHELFLHGDREVLPVLERLAGGAHLLLRAQSLGVTHVASLFEALGAAR